MFENSNDSVKVTYPGDGTGYDGLMDTYFPGQTPNAVDMFKPKVESVTPSGDDAPVDGDIVITFSEPMDTSKGFVTIISSALQQSYSPKPVSWNAEGTVATFPYSDLTNSATYAVDILTFVDKANKNLETVSFGFTTEAKKVDPPEPPTEKPTEAPTENPTRPTWVPSSDNNGSDNDSKLSSNSPLSTLNWKSG